MMDPEQYVAAVAHFAGNEGAGKTRLQKIAYLLEEMELGCGLEFDYHKFGPFSAALAFAVDDAYALDYLEAREKCGHHAVHYTTFVSLTEPNFQGDEKRQDLGRAVEIMKGCSSVVLELAASAVYLERNGYNGSAWEEVKRRKAAKADKNRVEAAQKLVQELQLWR